MTVEVISMTEVKIDGVPSGTVVDVIANHLPLAGDVLAGCVSLEAHLQNAAEAAQQSVSAAEATIAGLQSQLSELTAQLEAILNPPNAIYPFEFVSLLTDAQLVAIQLSTDANLIRMRTQVQTIVSAIPFGDGSPLRNGVAYLGMVLPDLFPPSEVARIISRTAPE